MNIQMYMKKRQQQALFSGDGDGIRTKTSGKTHKFKRAGKSVLAAQLAGTASRRRGFTLIEILVVIGIIAVLASVVLVAINPARQFKLARDSQRTSNVESLLNAVGQNIAEHKGLFVCGATTTVLSATPTIIKAASSSEGIPLGEDLAPCLVPAYISALPFDPASTTAYYATSTDYDTDYTIAEDGSGRITVSSVGEITPVISVTR